jgi:outer membrane protein assembly factor BamA
MRRKLVAGRRARLLLAALLALAAGRAAALSSPPVTSPYYRWAGRTVREVRLTGNLTVRDAAIRRELFLQPGDRFDPVQLQRDLTFLKGLGILAAVEVDVLPQPEGIDLRYRLKERGDARYGLIYPTGSLDGDGIVKAGFIYRHRNLAGGREALWLETALGREEEVDLRLSRPWFRDLPVEHGISFLYRFRGDEDPQRLRRAGIYLAVALKRQRPLENRFLFSATWGRREFERDGLPDRERTSNLSLGFSHDTRNSILRPSAGGRFTLLSSLYRPWLDSSVSLTQMSLHLSRFRRVSARSTFALSLDGSNQWGELFYKGVQSLGGMDAVRGYRGGARDGWDGHDGPDGPQGRNRLLVRLELRHDLLRPYTFELPVLGTVDAELEGLVFADAGWLWSEPLPLVPAERRAQLHSVGLGLRLHTPIGDALRAELGLGEAGNVRLHLGAGLPF